MLSDAHTPAALAADLYLLGLTPATAGNLVTNLNGRAIDEHRIRQWCDGQRPVPLGVWDRLIELRHEHDTLLESWIATPGTIIIPGAPYPRNWYKAAASRLRAVRGDAGLSWPR